MNVYVLSRTEDFGTPRRILEGVYRGIASAEQARQELLKRYNAPSKLCTDTEINEFVLEP